MSYPRLIGVLAYTTKTERQWCTERTVGSLAFMRSLDDGTIMNVAQMADPWWADIIEAVGGDANPYWVQGQAAEIAYERGLIFEEELDLRRRA